MRERKGEGLVRKTRKRRGIGLRDLHEKGGERSAGQEEQKGREKGIRTGQEGWGEKEKEIGAVKEAYRKEKLQVREARENSAFVCVCVGQKYENKQAK